MQAEPVHEPARLAHQHLGPPVVAGVGPTGDFVDAVVAVVADVRLVAAVEVGVVLRPHVAPAAPVLVPHAEEGELPRLLPSVLPAKFRHLRLAGERDVFDPLRHLLDCAAPHVAADVRIRADHLAEVQEFMGSEVVVLDHATPVGVDPPRALLPEADPVHPVVLVGEAAARPAEDRRLQLLQGFDDVDADAPDIGDRRVLAHPHAFVDAAPEVLGEVPVDLPADGLLAQVGVDRYAGHRCGCPSYDTSPPMWPSFTHASLTRTYLIVLRRYENAMCSAPSRLWTIEG